MNATISLQNIDNSFLNLLQNFFKSYPNIKYQIRNDNENEFLENNYSANAVQELLKIDAQTDADIQSGKIPLFNSVDDFEKAFENGELDYYYKENA